MHIQTQYLIHGPSGRPFAADCSYVPDGRPKPLVVFIHGFKGFKDWGCWNLIAGAFTRAGCVFVKFNFSHNGVTIEQPLEFADLEAFGKNTYSRELADLDALLNDLPNGRLFPPGEADFNRCSLIGHSRGGPIALIQAARDPRIHRLITWAAVSTLDYAWKIPEFIQKWRESGVQYQYNTRTGQEMPLYFSLYEDYERHRDSWDTRRILQGFGKPMLILHGNADPAVPVEAALQLHEWYPASQLAIIEGADHVFGASHPWQEEVLPPHTIRLVEKSLAFIQ